MLQDDTTEIRFIKLGDIGDTSTLDGCYKLVAAMQLTLDWVKTDWVPLFRSEVLGKLGTHC